MTKPWSKLKSRVEALWDPSLRMAIHCTGYANSAGSGGKSRLSRHWLVLDRANIWDFPGPFIAGQVQGPLVPGADAHWPNGGSIVSNLLHQYAERPIASLFEPFPEDGWGLTDLLRAADRRLGRERLLAWARSLDAESPAHRVLAARFGDR